MNRPRMNRRASGRLLAGVPFMLGACADAGPAAGGPGTPWHHTADGFRNPPGSPTPGGDRGDWFGFFWRNMNRDGQVALPAGHVLGEAETLRLLARESGDSLTWLGHASFLIRAGGRNILTDPFLTRHASPLPPLGPERFAPPALPPAALPEVDVLLLSHNHYDHLDLPTLEALPRKSRMQVIVPLGVGRYLDGVGFARIDELDWGGRFELPGLRIHAVPAVHFSKRTLFDRNQTLWGGYLIEGGGRRIYFAGDTAYGPVFPQIGKDLGRLDMALLPIGAYEPRELMRGSHVTPEEAVRVGRDVAADRLVAMHWGTIQLTDEPPFEPPDRFRTAAAGGGWTADDAWVMAIGETRTL
jgi:N-acyl-phosphatidylethanolamine-hydrolysing phospholipase D